MEQANRKKLRKSHISYSKWGYIFLIPFFLVFFLFQFIPLFQTFYYSFFDYHYEIESWGMVGPTFIGFANYARIFSTGAVRTFTIFGNPIATFYINDFGYYALNTLIIWIIGFIPQILLSLLLAVWFTNARLRLHGLRFFKTVIYMPNLVMASAYGMLFMIMFSKGGPITQVLLDWGWVDETFDMMTSQAWVRIIIAFINFLMWFGNTTILLMAGVMGIDPDIYESAALDGANGFQVFRKVTMPLLKPIFLFVFMTSLIGGIQLFDVAQIFTSGSGGPVMSSNTIMMYLSKLIGTSQDFGRAGAVSVIVFLVTAVLSILVFKIMNPTVNKLKLQQKSYRRRMKEYKDCPLTREEISANEAASAEGRGI